MIKVILLKFRIIWWIAFFVAHIAGVAAACDSTAPAPTANQYLSASRAQTLVLGDIDADEPVKKIERFQPLANYLATKLGSHGIVEGRVKIARDIREMGRFMANGEVDVYFDSTYPTLAVQNIAGSDIILRRWKRGNPEIWSMFVARKEAGIDSVEDLLGRVVAVEEPFSTSGFLLPVGTLAQQGFTVTQVASVDELVGENEIGYLFSGDEENTIELVLQGKVAAGALSNEDFDALTVETMDRLATFGGTSRVPRQLVSVRGNLDGALVGDLKILLTGLDGSEEGRRLLEGLKQTAKFDDVPANSVGQLLELEKMIELLAER